MLCASKHRPSCSAVPLAVGAKLLGYLSYVYKRTVLVFFVKADRKKLNCSLVKY